MNAAQSAYAALSGPSAAALAKGLSEVADTLHGQLCGLSVAPEPDEAAAVAANLDGARRAVLRLREALVKERGFPMACRSERRTPAGQRGSEGAFAGRGMQGDLAATSPSDQRPQRARREAFLHLMRMTVLYGPPLTPDELEVFDWLRAREMARAEARRASPWWRG